MNESLLMSSFCTMVFIIFTHPLILVFVLTMQTIPVFFLFYTSFDNMWNSYMLFLIFLGGLLVIFVYLSALVPNELFMSDKNKMLVLFPMFITMYSFSLTDTQSIFISMNNTVTTFSFNFFMSFLSLMLTYLLAGLFSAMYFCEKTKTPLKTNTYEPS